MPICKPARSAAICPAAHHSSWRLQIRQCMYVYMWCIKLQVNILSTYALVDIRLSQYVLLCPKYNDLCEVDCIFNVGIYHDTRSVHRSFKFQIPNLQHSKWLAFIIYKVKTIYNTNSEAGKYNYALAFTPFYGTDTKYNIHQHHCYTRIHCWYLTWHCTCIMQILHF